MKDVKISDLPSWKIMVCEGGGRRKEMFRDVEDKPWLDDTRVNDGVITREKIPQPSIDREKRWRLSKTLSS